MPAKRENCPCYVLCSALTWSIEMKYSSQFLWPRPISVASFLPQRIFYEMKKVQRPRICGKEFKRKEEILKLLWWWSGLFPLFQTPFYVLTSFQSLKSQGFSKTGQTWIIETGTTCLASRLCYEVLILVVPTIHQKRLQRIYLNYKSGKLSLPWSILNFVVKMERILASTYLVLISTTFVFCMHTGQNKLKLLFNKLCTVPKTASDYFSEFLFKADFYHAVIQNAGTAVCPLVEMEQKRTCRSQVDFFHNVSPQGMWPL